MARRSSCCCRASDRRSICRTWASQVLHDLPGVGSNLHDHFNTYCAWRISRSLSLNVLHHSIPHQLVAGAKYLFWRGGPMSGNGLYVGALVRSDPALERPDLQMNISAWSTIDRTRDGIISHPFPAFRHQPGPSSTGRARHRAAEESGSAGAAGDPLQLPAQRLRHAGGHHRHSHRPQDRQPAGAEGARGGGGRCRDLR